MNDDLPKCQCGGRWDEAGGQIGGICQRNYRCSDCKRQSMHLSAAGGNLFLISAPPHIDISQRAIDWVNNIVLPTWRSNCTAGTPNYGERVPTPPRVPGDDVHVWLHHVTAAGDETDLEFRLNNATKTWEQVNPSTTQNMALPIDPIRVNHDAFFKDVFDAVGIPERVRKEIPNRYYKDRNNNEPWYQIEMGEIVMIVGPRKRVINIEMKRKDDGPLDSGPYPFDYTVLDEVAKRDNVTYGSGQSRAVRRLDPRLGQGQGHRVPRRAGQGRSGA